jgi:hypothetical protein
MPTKDLVLYLWKYSTGQVKNITQLHQNKHDSINLSWPLLLIWNLVYTCPVEYFQRYSTRSFVGIYFYLNDRLNYNMYIICIFFDGPLSKFVYTCLVWNLSNNIQNSMLFQYTMYLYITMLQEKEKKRTCYWTITYYPYDALK